MYKERTLRKRLQSATLLVLRVGEDGTLRESSPCKHCTLALKELGIKKIAYSRNDGSITQVRTRDIDIDSTEFSSGFRKFERIGAFT